MDSGADQSIGAAVFFSVAAHITAWPALMRRRRTRGGRVRHRWRWRDRRKLPAARCRSLLLSRTVVGEMGRSLVALYLRGRRLERKEERVCDASQCESPCLANNGIARRAQREKPVASGVHSRGWKLKILEGNCVAACSSQSSHDGSCGMEGRRSEGAPLCPLRPPCDAVDKAARRPLPTFVASRLPRKEFSTPAIRPTRQ